MIRKQIDIELQQLLAEVAELRDVRQQEASLNPPGREVDSPMTEPNLSPDMIERISQSVANRIRALRDSGRTWLEGTRTLLARLDACLPRAEPDLAVLGGDSDTTDTTRDIPLPPELRAHVPWAERLWVERVTGSSGGDSARYVATVAIGDAAAADAAADAIGVTLVAADGRRKEVILTASEPCCRFKVDMPDAWAALEVEVRPVARGAYEV